MNKNLPYFDARTQNRPKTQHTQTFVVFSCGIKKYHKILNR